MKKITVDGNEACSKTAYLFTDIAGIYPITPSSTMAEHIDEWSNRGDLNLFNDKVKVVEMQSEAGAAGFIHGALQTGLLATTFTASQGLLLMIPNMYKMAGEMLPAVIHVAARSLSTQSLSIFGDHQDIYATRQTGFAMLASSSVQDASYLAAVAHLSAIESSIPFLHFFDGFRTSHEINKINVLEKNDYENLLNKDALKKFKERSLNPLNPSIKGTATNDDIYFQMMESRNNDYNKIPDIVNDYMQKINVLTGSNYMPFNYYGNKDAKRVIVAIGSVNQIIKETIDELNEDIGLIEVHLYRPFSIEYLKKVLPKSVEKIAVLDRTKEAGSIGEPLYLDIVAALKDTNIKIVGGRYGLSSKNTTPSDIHAVYEMLKNDLKNNFTIGINDDVTKLSLKPTNLKIKKHNEFLIYGYGSDGMVSASKSLIKMIGDNTDNNVQGYFEYDSKKSGGITIGHLRFSDKKINSSYYVENPKLIVLTKESYLEKFDLLDNILDNGIFIISTDKDKDTILKYFDKKTSDIIKNRNIKVYLSRASVLANKLGLGNKISMIVESQILKVSNILDYNIAKDKLIEDIKKKFSKKGEEIINKNIKAVLESENYLEEFQVSEGIERLSYDETVYDKINSRKGNMIPVSEFLNKKDGTYEIATSKFDKRMISSSVPRWIKEKCIECNQCSFVCPHSVIRSFLLDEEEYQNCNEEIKSRCLKIINPKYKDYYFTIGISVKDCTGCGLCIKTCPKEALEFMNIDECIKEQSYFDYLNENVSEKNIEVNNIIDCGFKKPCFEFSGACAGCGETSYIRILTQLFGKNLVIANATGCSSIYGASMPSMPYSVPWASSLFEDNAEYGYGMVLSDMVMKNRIKNIMEKYPENILFKEWINNYNNYDITKKVYDNINYDEYPELKELKNYIIKRSNWMIGGDGWAFDIGFSGIDHVLASNDNVNILVLNTQVYSNTGGQTSKATPKGMSASFAVSGKKTFSKDLAKIALTYPHVFVAQINLGANMMQVIKALKEAEEYDGPSIVIAYCPCINHGIEGGMSNSLSISKLATVCGYYPIFRYNPKTSKFILDSSEVDFNKYEEFLSSQNRFQILKKTNPLEADKLLNENKRYAIDKFNYYKKLSDDNR